MTRFSESARRLAGAAGALLGWRPEEFWGATPAELAAIMEALSGGAEAQASRSDIKALMERFPDG